MAITHCIDEGDGTRKKYHHKSFRMFGTTHKINIIIARGSLPNFIHDQFKWLLHIVPFTFHMLKNACHLFGMGIRRIRLKCCCIQNLMARFCVVCVANQFRHVFEFEQRNNSHSIDFSFAFFFFFFSCFVVLFSTSTSIVSSHLCAVFGGPNFGKSENE